MSSEDNPLKFEWDETKRISTAEKHGIDFLDAVRVFEALPLIARSTFLGEERFVAIGPLDERFIAVVFMVRNDARRIITARRARDGEIKIYRELHSG